MQFQDLPKDIQKRVLAAIDWNNTSFKNRNDKELALNKRNIAIEKNEKLLKLIEWLNGEKYLIDEHSIIMTEAFEKEHKWELSRNRMINKTIKKIKKIIN